MIAVPRACVSHRSPWLKDVPPTDADGQDLPVATAERQILIGEKHRTYPTGESTMKRILCVLVLICLPSVAAAQVDRATLTGVVRDSTGAVLAGATVTTTHLATGLQNKATTTDDGTYLVLNLPPGEQLVEAQATGFQKFAQTVLLEVGTAPGWTLRCRSGSVNETVEVAGVTPLLDTQSAVVGSVVSRPRWRTCPWRCGTGTTCCSRCRACRATATPSRPARPTPGGPAASACTATGRCRTTSCSTAWTTTRSRPTCRS